MSTFYCDCRPADDKKDTNPIGVKDTEDEFVITKPETVDAKYTDFIDELYKHDNEKKAGKSKRDLSNVSEASIHDESISFDLAVNEIIRDNEDEKRGRRMLVFRYSYGWMCQSTNILILSFRVNDISINIK